MYVTGENESNLVYVDAYFKHLKGFHQGSRVFVIEGRDIEKKFCLVVNFILCHFLSIVAFFLLPFVINMPMVSL